MLTVKCLWSRLRSIFWLTDSLKLWKQQFGPDVHWEWSSNTCHRVYVCVFAADVMISRCKNIFIINCERKPQHSLINSPEIISLLLLKRGADTQSEMFKSPDSTWSDRCSSDPVFNEQHMVSMDLCQIFGSDSQKPNWRAQTFGRVIYSPRPPALSPVGEGSGVITRAGPGALPVWDDLQPSCQSWPLRYNNMRKTWTSTWHHHVAGNGLILQRLGEQMYGEQQWHNVT